MEDEDEKRVSSIVVERARQDVTVSEHGTISMGPEGVKLYRLLTIKSGLELEMRGLRLTSRAPTCYSIAKREFGLKGNKRKVYEQFCEMHGFEVKP